MKKDVSKKTNHDKSEQLKTYRQFIELSNEGIWRFELKEPIDTKLAVKAQVELIFKNGFLAEANDAMAAQYGFSNSSEIVGKSLTEFMIESDKANYEYLAAFIKSNYKLSGIQSHEKDKNGNDKYFINSLVGIVEKGYLRYAWGTQYDFTAQQEASEALNHSRKLLEIAMKVSQMGIWEWELKTDKLHWSNDLKKIFGLDDNADISYKKYMSLIHPEDVSLLKLTIDNAIKTGDMYQVSHRIVWPDRSIHWIQSQGKAFRKNGELVRMLGTAKNIDKLKKDEETLRESERRFRSMAEEQTALVELNEAKDEFISLASHQLRTPATGVKQFIGMLLENYFGELTDDQRTMLEYAYESNERQLEVINDLLKVAQVDAGKVVLMSEETDIADMLEDIMQEMRANFAKRKQRVLLNRPKDSVIVKVDAGRIRMVIENLIDNASKYTPDGKPIHVSIDESRDKKWVCVKIKDEGVGINPDDMPKLFQKFSRLDNPLSIQVGGTGIGLYWAKKIMDLHNGKIIIRSKPNEGSTFTVKIPA